MAIAKRIVKVDISKFDDGLYASAENVIFRSDRLIMRGANFMSIPHRTFVNVIVYYEDGIQLFSGIVTLAIPTQINIEIQSIASDKWDRRQSFKIRTPFDAKVVRMYSVTGRGFMNVDVPIRVRDLSVGGLGFFCNHPFFKKQKLVLDMSYLRSGFKAEFHILRKERAGACAADAEIFDAGFKFRYGGTISNITPMQECVITKHLFKVQLLEYHRRKDAE
jgi:hypothetical protein